MHTGISPSIPMTLGYVVGRIYYIETVLPFGPWSAAKIFNSVADALEWVVQSRGVTEICHYLYNFLIVGAPSSSQCADSLSSHCSTVWAG